VSASTVPAWWALPLYLVAGATAGWLLGGARPATPATAARTPTAEIGTPITSLPAPPSASTEAQRAYLDGVQNYRDGLLDAGMDGFRHAVALDPTLAAAHLRLAVWAFIYDPPEGRAHFHEAIRYKGSLSPRDQAFLDAMAPTFLREPSDWAEGARRLEALVARTPHDADLLLWLHYTHAIGGHMPEAKRAVRRSIAADPQYGLAWEAAGEQEQYEGDFDGAMASLDRCLEIAPSSALCVTDELWMLSQLGACDLYEAKVRAWIAADPQSATAYERLAEALYANHAPLEGVRATLDQAFARMPPAERPAREALWRLRLAVLAGDFAGAAREGDAYAALVAPRPDLEEHGRAARLRAAIAIEAGRAGDAADIAAELVRRKDAWMQDPRADDYAIAKDPTPDMLAALRGAGRISPEAFAAEREAWVQRWQARLPPFFQGYVWPPGYAALADTKEAAVDALAVLERGAPIPPFRPLTALSGTIGRTYLLAGRMPEALRHLRVATASCDALEFPFESTRAHLWLGLALEARGEGDLACAAYRVVLARWGDARSPSPTAGEARARASALGCAP
jgi:tetratricopeptide (TPR) repeat protein